MDQQQDWVDWLAKLPEWVAAPIGALITWLLMRLRKRFTFVTRSDFEEHKASRTIRDTEVDKKLDDIKSSVNAGVTSVHQRIDTLYRDLLTRDE